MDVDAEFAMAEQRIRSRIQRNTETALRRVDRPTRTEQKERTLEVMRNTAPAMEQVGAARRKMHDAFLAAAEAFARGWDRG